MEHLSSEELGAYLSNVLGDAERQQIERHLVSCSECRSELIEGQRALASAPLATRVNRSRFYVLGLAAAAAVAFAIWPRTDFRPGAAAIERNNQTAEAVAVSIVSPAHDSEITTPVFTWRKSDGASYKITVTDAEGRPFWSEATSDTTIAIPSSIQVPRGAQYFWYVDALHPDGRSITSGINTFRTPR